MNYKFVVYGSLLGILVGFVVQVFFPNFLLKELYFNLKTFENLGSQSDIKGSVLAVGSLVLIIFGLIGAFVGYVLSKL